MLTKETDTKEITNQKPANPVIFIGFIVAAVIAITIELIIFPNLLASPFYLLIIIGLSLFSFGSIGLSVSGLRRRLPSAAKWGVSLGLWGFAALAVYFLLVPLFVSGGTANDADPFASANKPAPAAQATTVPAVATQPTVVATTAPNVNNPAPVSNFSPTPTTAPATVAPVATTSAPAPSVFNGNFSGRGNYNVSGKAVLGKTPDGKNILRFEGFNSSNGPDLIIYLSKEANPTTSAQVKNGVEIGLLKATQGNLNFELDSALDLSQYKSVVIYCRAFSVLFGVATLS
jgi:hypothetical protein